MERDDLPETAEEQNPTQVRNELVKQSAIGLVVSFFGILICWSFLFAPSLVPAEAVKKVHSKGFIFGKKVFETEGCGYCHHNILAEARWGPELSSAISSERLVAYLQAPQRLFPSSDTQTHRGLLKHGLDGRLSLGKRGKALLTYLQKSSKFLTRYGRSDSERNGHDNGTLDLKMGQLLFQQNCVSCHGKKGKGDGALASKLPVQAKNLTLSDSFLCRSNQAHFTVQDLERTIRRGTGGCLMKPTGRTLSGPQMQALVEYVRRLSWVSGKTKLHPKLEKPAEKPERASRKELEKVRAWLHPLWEASHLEAKNLHNTHKHGRMRNLKDWKREILWKRFDRWVRGDIRRLRLSRADWNGAYLQKGRFAAARRKWLEKRIQKPFMVWLESWLCREVKPQKRWLDQSNRRACLERKGFQSYQAWRLKQEKSAFFSWKTKQENWLTWAWKGKSIYKNRGCARCHGTNGEGSMQKESVRRKGKMVKHSYQVVGFKKRALRCGSGPKDIHRSVVVGVGRCPAPFTKPLGKVSLSILSPPILLLPGSAKEEKNIDDWLLTAYIRFLSGELPIARNLD